MQDKPATQTIMSILRASRAEFAKHGFAGTRMDLIAKNAKVNKQALYYHFGSKENLYSAVLQDGYTAVYTWINVKLQELQVDTLPPETALRTLIGTYFDSVTRHPDFLDIISDENRYKGVHLTNLDHDKEGARDFMTLFRLVIERGKEEAVFRPDADAVQFWISAISECQFWLHHRYTLSHLLGMDIASDQMVEARREHVVRVILSAIMISGPDR